MSRVNGILPSNLTTVTRIQQAQGKESLSLGTSWGNVLDTARPPLGVLWDVLVQLAREIISAIHVTPVEGVRQVLRL